MSNLNLICLPEEILTRVFRFVDNRYQLSLVCKHVYKICCRLDKNKFYAKINGESILKDKIFNSIVNSLRDFDELHLTNVKNSKSFARVLQMLMKHGDKIRSLKLATVTLTRPELINLINELRSLNEIVIRNITIRSLDNSNDDTRIRNSRNIDKSMIIKTSVKTVFLDQHCDRKILSILNYLPADCIEKLVLRFPTNDMQSLQKFLCKQNQLKQLTIYTNFIQSISILHLRLTHLTIEARRITIEIVQSQQQCLEYLCIMNFPLNDDMMFEEICDCLHLKVLKVFVGNISSDKIQNVSRLKNLEELTVKSATKFDDEGQLTIWCSIKLPKLVVLEILVPNLTLNEEHFQIMRNEIGNQLTRLNIEKIKFQNLFTILKSFKELRELKVSIHNESLNNFNYQHYDYLKHHNLKFLSINSSTRDIEFSSLISLFPKLQRLIHNGNIIEFN